MKTRSGILINVCTRRFSGFFFFRGDEEVWSEMKRARKAKYALTKQSQDGRQRHKRGRLFDLLYQSYLLCLGNYLKNGSRGKRL